AYTGGVQIQHRFADDSWLLQLHTVGSWVHGTQNAIAQTQQDANHFFQRPDATDVAFDPTRTSIAGRGATWMFAQTGDTKHWRYGIGGDMRSPGLELSDAGFQTGSDKLIPYVWGQYHVDQPGEHLLNWAANADVFTLSNFEPTLLTYGIEGNFNAQ